MTTVDYVLPRRRRGGFMHYVRVLTVIAGVEFKTKYADSILGYAWSLAKPLAYFGVLWLVFGHVLDLGVETTNFMLFLLVGLVLYMFFTDSVGMMLGSIVSRGSILRRLSFPALLIPLSSAVAASVTFLINVVAAVMFIVLAHETPQWRWLLVFPLMGELYIFIIGLGLLIATLLVRFRDVAQLWELAAQLLIFASGIMYPLGLLPTWAQKIIFINPFVQVLQDIRHVLLGTTGPLDITANWVFAGYGGRYLPAGVAVLTFAAGLWLFRRDSAYFAERI